MLLTHFCKTHPFPPLVDCFTLAFIVYRTSPQRPLRKWATRYSHYFKNTCSEFALVFFVLIGGLNLPLNVFTENYNLHDVEIIRILLPSLKLFDRNEDKMQCMVK